MQDKHLGWPPYFFLLESPLGGTELLQMSRSTK